MHDILGNEKTTVTKDQKSDVLALANSAPGAVNGGAVGGSGLLHAAKLTVPQAAKALGIGETKMREIIRNGEVPVIRILGKILIVDRDLEHYLQGNYGALKPLAKKSSNELPPLPKYVMESSLFRKAS